MWSAIREFLQGVFRVWLLIVRFYIIIFSKTLQVIRKFPLVELRCIVRSYIIIFSKIPQVIRKFLQVALRCIVRLFTIAGLIIIAGFFITVWLVIPESSEILWLVISELVQSFILWFGESLWSLIPEPVQLSILWLVEPIWLFFIKPAGGWLIKNIWSLITSPDWAPLLVSFIGVSFAFAVNKFPLLALIKRIFTEEEQDKIPLLRNYKGQKEEYEISDFRYRGSNNVHGRDAELEKIDDFLLYEKTDDKESRISWFVIHGEPAVGKSAMALEYIDQVIQGKRKSKHKIKHIKNNLWSRGVQAFKWIFKGIWGIVKRTIKGMVKGIWGIVKWIGKVVLWFFDESFKEWCKEKFKKRFKLPLGKFMSLLNKIFEEESEEESEQKSKAESKEESEEKFMPPLKEIFEKKPKRVLKKDILKEIFKNTGRIILWLLGRKGANKWRMGFLENSEEQLKKWEEAINVDKFDSTLFTENLLVIIENPGQSEIWKPLAKLIKDLQEVKGKLNYNIRFLLLSRHLPGISDGSSKKMGVKLQKEEQQKRGEERIRENGKGKVNWLVEFRKELDKQPLDKQLDENNRSDKGLGKYEYEEPHELKKLEPKDFIKAVEGWLDGGENNKDAGFIKAILAWTKKVEIDEEAEEILKETASKLGGCYPQYAVLLGKYFNDKHKKGKDINETIIEEIKPENVKKNSNNEENIKDVIFQEAYEITIKRIEEATASDKNPDMSDEITELVLNFYTLVNLCGGLDIQLQGIEKISNELGLIYPESIDKIIKCFEYRTNEKISSFTSHESTGIQGIKSVKKFKHFPALSPKSSGDFFILKQIKKYLEDGQHEKINAIINLAWQLPLWEETPKNIDGAYGSLEEVLHRIISDHYGDNDEINAIIFELLKPPFSEELLENIEHEEKSYAILSTPEWPQYYKSLNNLIAKLLETRQKMIDECIIDAGKRFEINEKKVKASKNKIENYKEIIKEAFNNRDKHDMDKEELEEYEQEINEYSMKAIESLRKYREVDLQTLEASEILKILKAMKVSVAVSQDLEIKKGRYKKLKVLFEEIKKYERDISIEISEEMTEQIVKSASFLLAKIDESNFESLKPYYDDIKNVLKSHVKFSNRGIAHFFIRATNSVIKAESDAEKIEEMYEKLNKLQASKSFSKNIFIAEDYAQGIKLLMQRQIDIDEIKDENNIARLEEMYEKLNKLHTSKKFSKNIFIAENYAQGIKLFMKKQKDMAGLKKMYEKLDGVRTNFPENSFIAGELTDGITLLMQKQRDTAELEGMCEKLNKFHERFSESLFIAQSLAEGIKFLMEEQKDIDEMVTKFRDITRLEELENGFIDDRIGECKDAVIIKFNELMNNGEKDKAMSALKELAEFDDSFKEEYDRITSAEAQEPQEPPDTIH